MPNGLGGDFSSFERDPTELSKEIAGKTNGTGGGGEETPWPHLDKAAYVGPVGDIIRTIEPHSESDPAALLLTLLAYFGNAVGRGPYYQIEGDRHAPNLFCLIVGASGKARKGVSDGRVRQIFKLADPEWCGQRILSGLSSGEGLIWEVRNPITRMVKDGKGPNKIEEVVDEGVCDKRLLIVQSEFGGALRVMQRDGSILSTVIRDAWDRGDLGTLVKNSPARATGAHIGIIGHITATELRRLLDQTSMANGFGNRFLIGCVRRSQFLPFGGALEDRAITEMGDTVSAAIMQARRIGGVHLSEQAAKGWAAIYPALSSGRPGLLGALTDRADAQTIRVAMVYALWSGSAEITLAHLMAARAVTSFCEQSVRHIFGDSLGDPVADTILAALKNAGASGLTRTEISNLLSRHSNSGQIGRALKELSDRRLATMKMLPSSGGRPAETWFAAPPSGADDAGT
jgi:hypothetical protein